MTNLEVAPSPTAEQPVNAYQLMEALPEGYFNEPAQSYEVASERVNIARQLYESVELPPLLDLSNTEPLSLTEIIERRAEMYWMDHAPDMLHDKSEQALLDKIDFPAGAPPQLKSWALAKASLAGLLHDKAIEAGRLSGKHELSQADFFKLGSISRGLFRVEVHDGMPTAVAMDYHGASDAALTNVRQNHQLLREKYPILKRWPRLFRTYRFIHDAMPFMLSRQFSNPGVQDVAAFHYIVRAQEMGGTKPKSKYSVLS